jgi:hypothetical protein
LRSGGAERRHADVHGPGGSLDSDGSELLCANSRNERPNGCLNAVTAGPYGSDYIEQCGKKTEKGYIGMVQSGLITEPEARCGFRRAIAHVDSSEETSSVTTRSPLVPWETKDLSSE